MGGLTDKTTMIRITLISFPSPLEVIGGSYRKFTPGLKSAFSFPSPLEVIGGSYLSVLILFKNLLIMFPSPREANGGSYLRKEEL